MTRMLRMFVLALCALAALYLYLGSDWGGPPGATSRGKRGALQCEIGRLLQSIRMRESRPCVARTRAQEARGCAERDSK